MLNVTQNEHVIERKASSINLTVNSHIPHIIKYMGSKRSIIDFVISGINDCYTGGQIVDLFAGSSVLSGALRGQAPILSNDIQQYSAVLAETYLRSYNWIKYENILEVIISKAEELIEDIKLKLPDLDFDYNKDFTLHEFIELEKKQQNLINYDFSDLEYHLFMKYYSGTYWSFNQCMWIDVLRKIAEDFKQTNLYYPILSSLMFAMSYNSQSTGHYAQYRDATNERNMKDILIYRQKEILPYFVRKFTEFMNYLRPYDDTSNKVVSMDYKACLDIMEKGATVYADPPYCFVHYSRFYHAIETLVKYDYPDVKYKGRYRTDRHQSPFCIKTKVRGAFIEMFDRVNEKKSNLVLSYSNTGMIALEDLIELAKERFAKGYDIEIRVKDYTHSTMGRKEDKSRNVQEAMILIKKSL